MGGAALDPPKVLFGPVRLTIALWGGNGAISFNLVPLSVCFGASPHPNFLPSVPSAFSLATSADIHISPLSSALTFNPIVGKDAKDSI